MSDEIGSALISAGGSILGSLISGRQNYKNTKKLMNYQNQMNVANWRMENEYNSPAAQMMRLREAGLNPSLVYTSGTDNTGGTVGSSSPASMAGNVDYSQAIPSAVNTYFAAKMQRQQIENMMSQNDATKAMINIYRQQAVGEALKNARESAYLGHYKSLADLSVARAKAELEGFGLTNRLRGQQLNLNDVTLTKMGVEIDNMRKEGKAITESIAQAWARVGIEKALADSNIDVNFAQKEKLINESANEIRRGNLQALEYKINNFAFEQKKKQSWIDPKNTTQSILSGIYNRMTGQSW